MAMIVINGMIIILCAIDFYVWKLSRVKYSPTLISKLLCCVSLSYEYIFLIPSLNASVVLVPSPISFINLALTLMIGNNN